MGAVAMPMLCRHIFASVSICNERRILGMCGSQWRKKPVPKNQQAGEKKFVPSSRPAHAQFMDAPQETCPASVVPSLDHSLVLMTLTQRRAAAAPSSTKPGPADPNPQRSERRILWSPQAILVRGRGVPHKRLSCMSMKHPAQKDQRQCGGSC